MKQFPMKQQGFTLLELLVVITLLAVLSVGALVAYEGVGDNAQATAAANNIVTVDKAIRNFRAVTGGYPDQWDSLVKSSDGTATAAGLAGATQSFLVSMNTAAVSGLTEAISNLENVGIEEIQYSDSLTAGVAPNLAHNEAANGGSANSPQFDADAVPYISILPMGASCQVLGGTAGAYSTSLNNVAYTDDLAAEFQGKINDALGEIGTESGCNLVLALGFGHDAANSTIEASVSIASAPTYSSAAINPANNYARYVGLFWLGRDADGDNNIESAEMLTNPKLLAMLTPEGKAIDEALQAATSTN